MALPFQAIVLAAGQGTRMKSRRPKVLHRALGRSLVEHVLAALAPLSPTRTAVVIGAGADQVRAALGDRGLEFVLQDPPRGTGDAVARCRPALAGSDERILILSGDVPLLETATLTRLLDAAGERGGALLVATLADPASYGRIVRGDRGRLERIVEAKDASAAERCIAEVNVGAYVFPAAPLWEAVGALEPKNAQGEYYLTDAIETMLRRGIAIQPVTLDRTEDMTGVNTRADLAEVVRQLARRTAERHLANGVTILDPASCFIDAEVEIAADVTLHPFVRLEGPTCIGEGSEIRSFVRLSGCRVGEGSEIREGVVAENAVIGAGVKVGPWAHLRPGTELADDVRIGNFVETKKARLGRGSKASHLAYLGDAEIGEGVNVGAGTITCNYDGERKHRTVLEDGVFIGSDSQLVAPVTVGKGAYVGAGTTITKDVPPGALAISRTPQKNVEGWAARKKKR